MQICYRCEEKTNQYLEKIAQEHGISKNHLIDEIIKNYLKQKDNTTNIFHPIYTERNILAAIQLANEQLAQILDELNNLQDYIENRTDTQNANNVFQFFHLHAIHLLLQISKTLEAICKKYHPPNKEKSGLMNN